MGGRCTGGDGVTRSEIYEALRQMWQEIPSPSNPGGQAENTAVGEYNRERRRALLRAMRDIEQHRELRRALEAWANPPKGGMGAGLHSEMHPRLTPAARRRILELLGES